ncbi:HEAT repeat domain-containing protein [Streptomyces sp. NPDC048331]|uniref:HEAT repeat domain-containing protein n=1 Tax=Streptomyces sp. NPDC048331 TaxID=3365534 RepID=UPI0037213656
MAHGDSDLITAVRADDAARVRALLRAADESAPGTLGAAALGVDALGVDALGVDGLSPLDIAAARGSYPVVEVLRDYGVRLDRVGPDDRTPLLRAVDAGAYGVAVLLLFASVPLWPKGPDGRTALELARHWHETGAENELRRRTGATEPSEPAEFSRVLDDEYSFTRLLRLPGTDAHVRTGHTAILCRLEAAYGIRTPFAELLARAEAEGDLRGVTHDAAVSVLYDRADRETWEAAAALRTHPHPSVRHFGAEVVRCISLFDECEEGGGCIDGAGCVAEPAGGLFLAWAADERDPDVLAVLLTALADCPALPRATVAEALLPHARHPSAVVRRSVANAFVACADEESALPQILAYLQDGDAEVRRSGCLAVARQRDRSREVRDSLIPLLADPSIELQIQAVRALVLLDDPRGEEALDWLSLGYTEDEPGYWSLYDAHRHLRLREEAGRARRAG